MRIAEHLRLYVIEPVLRDLNLWSEAAEVLLIGTAAKESMGFTCLHQLGTGPALGLCQIEPATYSDFIENSFPGLQRKLPLTAAAYRGMVPKRYGGWPPPEHLMRDTGFMFATARLLYWRAPGKLPAADDLAGMAAYWKRYYNTVHGAGTEAEWLDWYSRCC